MHLQQQNPTDGDPSPPAQCVSRSQHNPSHLVFTSSRRARHRDHSRQATTGQTASNDCLQKATHGDHRQDPDYVYLIQLRGTRPPKLDRHDRHFYRKLSAFQDLERGNDFASQLL